MSRYIQVGRPNESRQVMAVVDRCRLFFVFVVVSYFSGCCFYLTSFFGFRFDPYTKLARVTGMATIEAVFEVFFGELLWFWAYWSSGIDRSLSL